MEMCLFRSGMSGLYRTLTLLELMWKARLRAISLSISIFSMLFWAYVSGRLIFSGPKVQPAHYFIDDFPSLLGLPLTFMNLGIITFLVGFVFFVIYAVLRETQRELEYLAKIRLMDMAEEDYVPKKKELKGREIA